MFELNEGEIYKNEGEYSSSFYLMSKNKLAIAEMSIMEPALAKGYLSIMKTHSGAIEEILDTASEIYFFNRLNVPDSIRGHGFGSKLMDTVIQWCKDNNYALLNTASSYGDLKQDSLIEFYQRHGMKLLSKEGLMLYANTLDYEPVLASGKKKKIG